VFYNSVLFYYRTCHFYINQFGYNTYGHGDIGNLDFYFGSSNNCLLRPGDKEMLS